MGTRDEEEDPLVRAASLERRLRDLRHRLDAELDRDVADERARQLFATSREIVDGLVTAFGRYQESRGLMRDGLAEPP